MAQYNHLPVFQLTYKLTLDIYGTTHQFAREYKYTIGQKLKELASDLMGFIIAANSAKTKSEILQQAIITLEQLKIHLRLTNDLKILGLKRYEAFSRMTEEISKQLSGWLNWMEKTK